MQLTQCLEHSFLSSLRLHPHSFFYACLPCYHPSACAPACLSFCLFPCEMEFLPGHEVSMTASIGIGQCRQGLIKASNTESTSFSGKHIAFFIITPASAPCSSSLSAAASSSPAFSASTSATTHAASLHSTTVHRHQLTFLLWQQSL